MNPGSNIFQCLAEIVLRNSWLRLDLLKAGMMLVRWGKQPEEVTSVTSVKVVFLLLLIRFVAWLSDQTLS